MVEATVADIVGPAIAADDPDGFLDEIVGQADQVLGSGITGFGEFFLQYSHAFALGVDAGFVGLVGVQHLGDEVAAQLLGKEPEQLAGIFVLFVNRQPHAEAKLGVVFEQRVRPGRAASLGIDCPRCGGQVSAVDRGAAGRIGDHRAVAEQLRDKLDIRGFTAAGTGTTELKERAQQLRILDGGGVEQLAIEIGDLHEEVPILGFLFADRRLGSHVDGFAADLGFILDRADFHAQGTTRAIFRGYLKCVGVAGGEFLEFGRHVLEGLGSICQQFLIVDLVADDRVRTDHDTLAALDAQALIPDGDVEGNVALLPLGRTGGEGAVDGEGGNGDVVAVGTDDLAEHLTDEGGCPSRDR